MSDREGDEAPAPSDDFEWVGVILIGIVVPLIAAVTITMILR